MANQLEILFASLEWEEVLPHLEAYFFRGICQKVPSSSKKLAIISVGNVAVAVKVSKIIKFMLGFPQFRGSLARQQQSIVRPQCIGCGIMADKFRILKSSEQCLPRLVLFARERLLTIDHILPRPCEDRSVLGQNVQPMCIECNKKKGCQGV